MSHIDPAILALRALGETAGSAQDDAHTATCADCQLELERLGRVVALARDDGPGLLGQPPAVVWERIAAATGETMGTGETTGTQADGPSEQPPRSAQPGWPAGRGRPVGRGRNLGRGRGRRAVAAAAAIAGLVIGIGGTVAVSQLSRPAASQVIAAFALRPLAQFPQWQGAAGTAVLRTAAGTRQLAVSVTAPRRAGFFEVWMLGRDGTSMISLGDLSAAGTGTFSLPAGVDLRFYSRIDVSLQPFNGSTQHSSTSVVRGSMPAAASGATNS